jgi:hypothetical protein
MIEWTKFCKCYTAHIIERLGGCVKIKVHDKTSDGSGKDDKARPIEGVRFFEKISRDLQAA